MINRDYLVQPLITENRRLYFTLTYLPFWTSRT
jgi:hypothetical protein